MLTDEQAMKLIEKRKITKFKNGEKDPELLEFILNYLEKNNDLSLLKYILIDRKIFAMAELNTGYKRLVDITIKHGDPNYIYALALALPSDYIKDLETAVIKTENPKFIYKFATKVLGADIETLWVAMLKTENIKYIHDFILHVRDIEFDTLLDIAKEQGNVYAINLLNSYDIHLNKELECGLITYATNIVINNYNKLDALNELIDSVTDKESLMKLKIYGEFLQKISDIDDMLGNMDIDSLRKEALELDKEYTGYVKKKSK